MIERGSRVLGGLLLAAVVWLFVGAAMTPLPKALGASVPGRARSDRFGASTRVVDRNGELLREVRGDDHTRAIWVPLEEIGDRVTDAVLVAEDRRFYEHVGVDPLASVRAALSSARSRRVVSGASTLTMQLARLVVPHPRTFRGKLSEMAMAVRIEASLDKRTILEEYLNRAPFGDNVRGIGAASRYWFDKPPRDLSLAEAATLAALPRGPHYYALDRHPERVKARRDRILARMPVGEEERARAMAEPLTLQTPRGGFGAAHLVDAILRELPERAERPARIETTLDAGLQREVEGITRTVLRPLADRHVTAASVLVIDNASGEVRAYVGSPQWDDDAHLGKNDGVVAARQPGSTLKPFVYAFAMEDLGWNPATLLPDVELHIETSTGTWSPKNYDERFHGPVLLREALASSYNVPAVYAAREVGEGRVLERLREVGFSLSGDAGKYGLGIVLGDGEVRLWDLARAYAALARGGLDLPLRTRKGQVAEEPKRVLDQDAAAMITDVLRDRQARVGAFGRTSPLDLAFDVAAKTGTSKGYRDNWTVGYTRELTVAVWTGNFDGSPMLGVSGITGAAPLFAEVMTAAMRGVAEPASLAPEGLEEVSVCVLSGGTPGPACEHARRDRVRRGSTLGACTMHESVDVDPRNGLRAGPACEKRTTKTYERWPDAFAAWAEASGRRGAPEESSPHCPTEHRRRTAGIRYPHDGASFLLDPERPIDAQKIPVKVDAAARVYVDGRLAGNSSRGEPVYWSLVRGAHRIEAEVDGVRSDAVTIRVE